MNAAELPSYDGSFRTRNAHATFLSRLARVGRGVSSLPGPRPTAARLERHAERFGPEQVMETAAELGIQVVIQRARQVRRVSGPSLKTRVAALVADGHSVDTIAEMEDLSPARARRLVEEVS
jgi:hypothetical protein